ncbi:MAG: hypothetical protein P8Y44_01095 [Acidobacteriota bacterium]
MNERVGLLGLVLVCGLHLGCPSAEAPVGEIRVEPEQVELPYPGFATVRLNWNMQADLGPNANDPMVFVHLLDSGGGVARTFDHPLPAEWIAGEQVEYSIDLYQSALAPPLSDGTYRLTLGLYDTTGMRWPLSSAFGPAAGTEYQVGEVVVDNEAVEAPMFFFSPSWLTLEAGNDAQILGRRWLSGEGTIRVANLPESGTLWLRLRIPDVEGSGTELVLDEGATEATVVISGSCGIEETVVEGAGAQEIYLDVSPEDSEGSPGECEVSLSPNFRLIEDESPVQRSVSLELLSWTSAS